MKAEFRLLKVREVFEKYETDAQLFSAISNALVSWDATDIETGKAIPLPEKKSHEWAFNGEMLEREKAELIQRWIEWRSAQWELPKASAGE